MIPPPDNPKYPKFPEYPAKNTRENIKTLYYGLQTNQSPEIHYHP